MPDNKEILKQQITFLDNQIRILDETRNQLRRELIKKIQKEKEEKSENNVFQNTQDIKKNTKRNGMPSFQ